MRQLLLGVNLSASAAPDADPVGQALAAEGLGFDFVSASDHPCGTSPSCRRRGQRREAPPLATEFQTLARGQGEPGAGYPLPWSVQTWLPGTVATDEDPGESAAFAHDLAEFIHGHASCRAHRRRPGRRGCVAVAVLDD
jgi:hypothetical protein